MTPNKFLEDCFALLASSEEVRDRFNLVRLADLITSSSKGLINYHGEAVDVPYFQPRGRVGEQFVNLGYDDKFLVITTLLSKVKVVDESMVLTSYPPQKCYKLEAVMPFLEKENPEIKILTEQFKRADAGIEKEAIKGDRRYTPKTLLELLNKTFNESITLQGKSLDEVLEIINQIYTENL